jgi:hypothetical protein
MFVQKPNYFPDLAPTPVVACLNHITGWFVFEPQKKEARDD